jgi:hypothetical protein
LVSRLLNKIRTSIAEERASPSIADRIGKHAR